MKVIISIIVVFNLVFCGCAKAITSKPRYDNIIANDHGWIEIEIVHEGVESITDTQQESEMPLCNFSVYLNNEPVIKEKIIPFGKESPYKTDTGFRIPAPVGKLELEMHYSGCSGYEVQIDAQENQNKIFNSVDITQTVEVKKNMVVELYFDGNELISKGVKQNDVITLQDINQKMINIENKISGNISN